MTQLTIRGFDPLLEKQLRKIAKENHWSLNKAALYLMRRGAGIAKNGAITNAIGDGLDRFCGLWNADEADRFDESIKTFERIDSDLWQ